MVSPYAGTVFEHILYSVDRWALACAWVFLHIKLYGDMNVWGENNGEAFNTGFNSCNPQG